MLAAAIRGVVRRLGPPADPPPDSDLVAAFAARRDADAFAALVARHGPTVLGVCRRVLGHAHDAEDAFQATFLVLALKASAVRPPGAVGGWLYGVAVRTANKAKVAAARRRRREMVAASAQASRGGEPPGSSPEHTELQSALDAELARLPDALRAAVVLCDLHGKTRSEAAAELGCPEGTIAARLHRARKKLADALARRGLALPAAALVTVLAPAAVSAAVARSALAAALGPAPPVVLALAREVTRSMTATKSVLAFGVLSLVTGGLLAAGGLWPAGAPNPPAAPPPAEVIVTDPTPADAKPAPPWREAKVLEQDGWLAGSVAYSPDGKTLYVGGTRGSGHVRAYETATWKQLWDYKSDGHFPAVGLAPDGKTLAVTIKDGVQFLDAATGKAGDTLEEKGSEPLAVAFFADLPLFDDKGVLLATSRKVILGSARGQFVKTWLEWPKVSTITTSTVPPGKEPADRYAVPLAVSPDGKRVVTTGPVNRDTGKNVLWAWSAGSGADNKSLDGHKAVVTAAAWSADGQTIVTGDAGGVVITWDAATFKETARLMLGGRVAALAVSANSKHTAASVGSPMPQPNKNGDYTEELSVWETANPPKQPKPIYRHNASGPFQGVASLAFAPDGKTLVSAFCNFDHLTKLGELRGKVRVFTLQVERPAKPNEPAPARAAPDEWAERSVLTHHAGPVDSVAFAPDGKTFVSGGADGKVFVWDAATLRPRELGSVFPPGKVTAVAFSPDGKLVAATRDKVTGFFDPRTRQAVQMRPPFPGGRGVAFSPDGKWVATSDGYTTGFRGLTGDGEAYATREGTLDGQLPAPVAWSADSLYLAGIMPTDDGNWLVEIAGVTPETKPRNLDGHKSRVHAVAWSQDGKLLASGGEDGTVILWDGQTFKELRRGKFVGRDGGPTLFHGLTFSPDGKTLAAAVTLGSGRGVTRVILIDTATAEWGGNLFPPAEYPVRTVAFSPDGKRLAAACGIDREKLKPLMTPDEMKATGAVVVWDRKP